MYSKRLAALGLTLAAIGATAAPAMAASSAHWTSAKCSAYAKTYTKASKARKTAADKTLKLHGCKITVK